MLTSSAVLHLGALAGLLVSPAHWPLAVAATLANHVALAAAGMWPRSTLLGPNLRRLADPGRQVALTFDDGPDPLVTPHVLDRLDAAGAKATFFFVGRRALDHAEIVAEAAARGHRLENHTFVHPNTFALLPPRALGREIDRAQEVLAEVGGRPPRWFRAPAGIRSPWLEPLLARRGLHLVSWTRRGFDAIDGDPERVSRRLLEGLAPGDILVMHDGSLVSDRDRSAAVLSSLDRVLGALDAAGLRAVSLPDPEPHK